MRYPDKSIRSVAEFLTELKIRRLNQPIWFRGQEKNGWALAPSITRVKGGISAEQPLITRFKQNALALLTERPATEWEWLFVMRHYGVPTRLLDWSESPLVALYFSVVGQPKSDGTLWCLLPIELNSIANIRLSHPAGIPGFGDDSVLDNYLPTKVATELTSDLSPAAALAPRNSRRMQAQHGVFTITHRSQTAIEKVGDQQHLWRYKIPKSAKRRIRSELATLNIDQLSLFPELDHVAAHAKELLK